MRIDKKSMMEVLHREHAFSDMFVAYLLTRNIRYEEIIVDTNFKRFARPFGGDAGSLFDFFTRGASVARSELSQAATVRRQPADRGQCINR